MAHLVNFKNEQGDVAYVNEKPWHGLGTKLDEDAPFEQWRIAAGLDFEIHASPTLFVPGLGEPARPVPQRKTLFRSDNQHPLSVVSDNFKVVQPETVLEFFRDIVETGDFQMHTAGVLDEGRKIWALAKTGHSFRLRGTDQVDSYLLLATACDGSLATTAQFTSVRVVCWNTLSYSVEQGEKNRSAIKIPHNALFEPEKVKAELGLVNTGWKQFMENLHQLADRKVSKTEAQKWLVKTFGDPKLPIEEQPNAAMMKGVYELFDGKGIGMDLAASDHTAWGLVNATTEFLDHHRRARSNNNRLNSAWFGNGAAFKQKAFENALELAA